MVRISQHGKLDDASDTVPIRHLRSGYQLPMAAVDRDGQRWQHRTRLQQIESKREARHIHDRPSRD